MIKKIMAMVCSLALVGGEGTTTAVQPSQAIEQHVDPFSDIDAVVSKALDTFKMPGAAVGIVVDGKVVFTKGYGVRDLAKDLPVTEETLFPIGSCTKAFTTFVLGQLVDERMIAWDDPVIKYIPEFRLKDTHATHHLTIRDLVAHRSGLPRHDLLWYNSEISRNELIQRLQYLEPSKDLREMFQYNNLMYMVAGIVIERVTGQSWEDRVRSHVFVPLGMERSNFSIDEMQKSDNFSLAYTEKNDEILAIPFRNLCNVGPAGSINASIADMLKWLQVQLSAGTLIKKETLREMQTIQIALSAFPTELSYGLGYGLGWFVGIHKGHYVVEHAGGIDGFISRVAMLPQKGIGVVVLSNSSGEGAYFVTSVVNTIFDRLLGDETTDWLGQMRENLAQVKAAVQSKKKEDNDKPNILPARPFNDYVGTYEHPGYGFVEVSFNDNQLTAIYNRIELQLRPQCYDHFKAYSDKGVFDGETARFSFLSNSSGEIAELHIPLEAVVGPIVFKKKPSSALLAADYLKQFEGVFEGLSILIETQLRGKQLMLIMPGQPPCELVPEKPLHFAAKGLAGYSVRFTPASECKMAEISLISLQGIFNFTALKEESQ